MCRYHLLLKVALHDCLEVIVRKMFQFGRCATVQADKKIIAQHGRYRDSNAYGCGYQRLANRSRHHIQAGRTFAADVLEGMHDAPDGAEKANERGGAAKAGQPAQTRFHRRLFFAYLLFQGPFEQFMPGRVLVSAQNRLAWDFCHNFLAGLVNACELGFGLASRDDIISQEASDVGRFFGKYIIAPSSHPAFAQFQQDDAPGEQ
jgi:hypothetical protein